MTKPKKDDASKPRPMLLPVIMVREIINVLEFGAKKYEKNGWKTVPNAVERYLNALDRHWLNVKESWEE